MHRRDALKALAACGMPGMLAGCGGGPGGESLQEITSFTLDRDSYFVGETAFVTAVFTGGTGRIEPGGIPVTSAVPQSIPRLAMDQNLRLLVTSASGVVSRELIIRVRYRDTFQVIAMGSARASHQAVETTERWIVITGGEDNKGELTKTVLAFDPFQERFVEPGERLAGRVNHTASPLSDGTVLVVGGGRSLPGAPIAERFNPRTGLSQATHGQPLVDRSHHAATVLDDGCILLTGGAPYTDGIDLYDPRADRFSRLPVRLHWPRFGHTATKLSSGRVLVSGGATVSGDMAPPELLNLAARTSTVLTGTEADALLRYRHAVVRTGDRTFLIGGELYREGTPLGTVAQITDDPTLVKRGRNLLAPRINPVAAPLADGRVLVAGGGASGLISKGNASTEFHAPSTGTATVGPIMNTARMFHSAHLLVTGKVLIIGGIDENQRVVTTAELFS